MVCTDLRKVWTDVKGHRRQALKCINKKAPRKRRKNKKKITEPLKLAHFVRPPGYRRSQKRKKKKKTKKTEETLTPSPSQK